MYHNPSLAANTQANTDPVHDAAAQVKRSTREWYQRLLAARLTTGRRVIDELCHGKHDIQSLYRESELLEAALDGFARYRRRDYTAVVVPAEAGRVHTPGVTRPIDDKHIPCSLCRKADALLDLSTVIPARDAA